MKPLNPVTTTTLYLAACLWAGLTPALIAPLMAQSKDEKSAATEAKDWKFNACRTIAGLVFHNWPCHPHPAAEPKACIEAKQQQLQAGDCRAGLQREAAGLKLTGKTHGVYFHKKFSGYKSSGPFVEVLDKQQNIWWVMKFDWDYAAREDQ